MEQFLSEIDSYAERAHLSPSTVAQLSVGASGTSYRRWKAGQSFPRGDTMDRIRAWMADHPVADPAPSVPQ